MPRLDRLFTKLQGNAPAILRAASSPRAALDVAATSKAQRAAELEALESTRRSKALPAAIEELAKQLGQLGTGVPPAGGPGVAVVRVIGARQASSPYAVPLGELLVRIGDAATGAGARTDVTGAVELPLPQAEGDVPVFVLAPDGQKPLAQGVVTAAGSVAAPLRLSIGFTAGLEAAFATGEAWHAAMAEAAERVAELVKDVEADAADAARGMKEEITRLDELLRTAAIADRNGGTHG